MNDNIDIVDKYLLDGNQLVDIRWAIGSLIRRLENDMNMYNFVKGGDCHTQIQELKKLLLTTNLIEVLDLSSISLGNEGLIAICDTLSICQKQQQ